MSRPVEYSISDAFHNKDLKPGYTRAALAWSFRPVVGSIGQLARHILTGGAFAPATFHNGHRAKEDFHAAQLVGLDFDTCGIDTLIQDDFIARYAILLYETPTSTPEAQRARAVFVLPEALTSAAEYERRNRQLILKLAYLDPDANCKDASRLFYGSAGKHHIVNPDAETLNPADLPELPTETPRAATPAPRFDPAGNTRAERRARAYVVTMMTAVYDRVASAGQGSRNSTLFSSAASAFDYAAILPGQLTPVEVEQAMLAAAMSAGLSETEAQTTITSAAAAKYRKERHVPDFTSEPPKPARQPKILQNAATSQPGPETPAPRSWWTTATIPALTRGAAIAVIGGTATIVLDRVHRAFMTGALSGHSFSIDETAAAIGQDARKVRSAIEAGEGIFYIKLRIEKEDDSLCANSCKNSSGRGRPADRYTIQTGAAMHNALFEALKKHRDNIDFDAALPAAMPVWTLSEDVIGEDNVPVIRGEKIKKLNAELTAYATEDDHLAQRRNRVEMYGNKRWQGWRAALEDTTELPIETADTAKQYRVNILKAYLSKFAPGTPHECADLARLCGCGERAISALRTAAGYRTELNQPEVRITHAANEESIIKQIKQARAQNIAYVLRVNAGDVSLFAHQTAEMLRHLQTGGTLTVCLNAPAFHYPIDPVTDQTAAATVQNTAVQREILPDDEPASDEDEREPAPALPLAARILWTLLKRKGYERSAAGHIVTINGGFIIFHDPTLSDLITVAANTAPAWKRFPQAERKHA